MRDRYLGNVTRHLAVSERWSELEEILCDVPWTMQQMELGGGRPAPCIDFERVFARSNSGEECGMHKLHWMLNRSWSSISHDRSWLAFYVSGHLSIGEREAEYTARYLANVDAHYGSPWLHPLTKCVGLKDGRELTKWMFDEMFSDVYISWATEELFVTCQSKVHVWYLSGQDELEEILCDVRWTM